MFRKFLIIACAMLVVSGCASKGKFVYIPSFKSIESDSGKKVVLLAPITDGRNKPWNFDINYDGDLIKDMQLILQDELLRTNLFNKVLMATESIQDIKIDVLIEPTLIKLEWKVPEYKALVDRMFYASFLTGGIGGLIYGYTDTDVYGDTTIRVRVTDKEKGSVLLEKSYKGHHEEQMSKLGCDSPATKVKMANEALKEAIAAMNSDLKDVFATAKTGMVSPQ